jgi:hypothetical protein
MQLFSVAKSSGTSIHMLLIIIASLYVFVEADILEKILPARSLPSVILQNSFPVACWKRRRGHMNGNKRRSPIVWSASIKKTLKETGYYYGLPQKLVASSRQNSQNVNKKETLDNLMNEALAELRGIRQEMNDLRRELKSMKRQLGHDVLEDNEMDAEDHDSVSQTTLLARIRKQREWDRIGIDIEKWAEKLLFEEDHEESEENGWKEIKCSKLCPQYNKNGRTRCYMKWMKDSRGIHADPKYDEEYPCMKVYATLDAPIEKVCAYLADEKTLPEYNDLIEKHSDLDIISPHSKICWGQTPKILFIQPRNFITFCHHRWLRDGTVVIVNQACEGNEYASLIAKKTDATNKAYALRGANFLSPHPDDPNKTRFTLLAHAHPGHDVSPWMCRVAINSLAPIEPFKLFYRINKNVLEYKGNVQDTQMVKIAPGRSSRPVGLSQMGYACFWPNGGGLKEGLIHPHHPDHVDPNEEYDNADFLE